MVACSGARQTFVPVSAQGDPIGRGILWSDHRAAAEARGAGRAHGRRRHQPGPHRDPARRRGGGGQVGLAGRARARAPGGRRRDPVPARLHRLPHDRPAGDRRHLRLAAAGCTTSTATPSASWPGRRWASSRASCRSDTVVGKLKPVPGAELGLRPGIPVVIGAGDRQCEVLGSGASEDHPMVSWGTTGNVSVPVHERPVPSPAGAVVTRAADGGWLLEGGLSAAGSFLAWLGRLLGRSTEDLGRLAAESAPGARGVVAVPVARRRPRPVVARRRPRRVHGPGRGARRGRPGAGRRGVRGLGRPAGHGGGDGRAPRWLDGGGRDARGRRVGAARLGGGPDVRPRDARRCAAARARRRRPAPRCWRARPWAWGSRSTSSTPSRR